MQLKSIKSYGWIKEPTFAYLCVKITILKGLLKGFFFNFCNRLFTVSGLSLPHN